MYGPAILILGAPAQTAALAEAFGAYAVQTWTDEPERAFTDNASLGWADALVVVDTTDNLAHGRSSELRDFDGPRILATSAPLSYPQIDALMHDGFDAVIAWPSSADVLAARAARLVRAGRAAAVAAPRSIRRLSA
ncbi:MAG: hypothetical protein O3A10_05745 [Chloroflexi bacterium]|nr:hypothetical protein [Chloroflexota bacterium]MDA1146180.1 hypothetical protein [Chloroflexota bacterium]